MKNNSLQQIICAYWHKEGLDIYSYAEGKPVPIESDRDQHLKRVKSLFSKKVLIVGRERLMHIRKRYPPAEKEKLIKAVNLEIAEIFPLSHPDFYCRVSKSISNYVEMDIWAWESGDYEDIQSVFPFGYVIPEDMLFSAEKPEISIFQHHNHIHLLAYDRERFLEVNSVPSESFDQRYIHDLVFDLNQTGEDITSIKVYGLPQILIENDLELPVSHVKEPGYPPCVAHLIEIDLREYKKKGMYRFIPQPTFIMRICIYLVLGYSLTLILTWKNYDQAIFEIKRQVSTLDKKLDASEMKVQDNALSEIHKEINEKYQKKQKPLEVLNLIAKNLPEGSLVKKLVWAENTLELLVSSKDPFSVVKSFSGNQNVQNVTIKGSPSRDRNTGLYNFSMILELK
jgi:hypothetical protein